MRAKSRLIAASALIAAPAIIHDYYPSAFGNGLTRLIPDLYAGLDVVSRELVGYIPSAFRNASAERAAVGQSVVYPISSQKGTFDVTPAMVIPEPSDTNIGNGVIMITKAKGVEFGWTGEEQRGVNNGGPGYLSLQADQFAQALRTLTNAIEVDLAVEAAANVSRVYGTPGTTPFAAAAGVGPTAQVRKMLDDNGAPLSGRSLIIDTSAGANLRSLANLTKANEAGTTMVLTDGTLINLNGLLIKESAQVQSSVAGTAAASTTSAAGFAKGATVIALAAASTGTIPAGSVITFAGDTNQYGVVSGDADVSNGGSITLAEPGLRQAIPAAATLITLVAKGTMNTAFSSNALHLVARAPALPQEGDAAIDRMLITDSRSGMTYEVALYAGYRKVRAEVVIAWGVKAVKREHIVGLFG